MVDEITYKGTMASEGNQKNFIKILGLIILILLLDQVVKFYVKTTFTLGDGIKMFGLDWAQIRFVENYGAAFGMELGGKVGKYILTVFRLVAGGMLFWFTYDQFLKNKGRFFVISLAMITAGAFGNIIDGLFYGVLFSDSSQGVAEFLPSAGGYSTFFDGYVVDMFYFPIIDTHWPEWVPKYGGRRLIFNQFIFNVADVAITTGTLGIVFASFRSKKSQNAPTEELD
ncbi:MAG: lipoprotein signal peptidase [Bacteroidota bacterium]